MRKLPGGVIAAGVLCGIAATVAVWSGPLAAASGDLHSAAGTGISHQAAPVHATTTTPTSTSTPKVSK